MGNNDWKKRLNIVYSTNPNFQYETPEDKDKIIQTLSPNKQKLSVSFERAGRAGKVVTLVSGFVGTDEDCKALAKDLKTYCGAGGSVKDGTIVVQGDLREKVKEFLTKNGYHVK